MNTQVLSKKVAKLEEELLKLQHRKRMFVKVKVDDALVQQASKTLFDFDMSSM